MKPSWWDQASIVADRFLKICRVALLLALAVVAVGGSAIASQTIETPAKFAFLIDLSSNTVLLDKSSDVATPPASMSKMMTVLMVLERLKAKTLKNG